MDFQIRNPYIKKFLHGFSDQNQLKVIKYLAILGINHLEASKNLNISFPELRKTAKNISKSVSKEQKLLNKELDIIKTELAKLNQKFEEKLKDGSETPSPNKKPEVETGVRSASVPKNQDTKKLTNKPPSRWRPGQNIKSQEIIPDLQQNPRRASSIEPSTHSNLQETHQKNRGDITPKPNEIAFPRVDPRENINYVTRHHLDDTEAKRLMKEEGVIYFPQNQQNQTSPLREKDWNKIPARSYSHSKVNQKESQMPYQGTFAVRKLSDNEDHMRQDLMYEPTRDYREFNKSPKFAQAKENISNRIKTSPTNDMRPERDTEVSYRNPIPKPQKSKGSGFKSNKTTNADSQKSAQAKKVKQKILRDKAMNVGRGNRSTQAERPSTNEFNHVESKIRDEVKYHKELSKQYKKMKQSIQEYTDHGTEKFSNASSSLRDQNRGDKFLFVEKDDERGYVHQYPLEQSQSRHMGYTHPESSSSQRSMYLKESSSQYSNKSPSYSISLARSRRSEMPVHNDNNLSQSKYSAVKGNGGMLDIANSFLNSPFMQHLSNLDAKHSHLTSGTSSINPSASASMRGHYDEEHTGAYGQRTQGNYRRSPHLEDESRMRETNQNYSKQSEHVPYRSQRAARKEHSSMLRESGNQRYAEYIGKEQGSASKYQKNEGTSFASSNFSNFLNDEMKGFFQKETLDLKRPKHSRSMVRSSANSSHISFNANEFSTNFRDGNNDHSRKGSYNNPQDNTKYNVNNNKSYVGDLTDTSNVFKQERMSVTQLLNTTS